jgi:thiol:disulfide interchange protein DsbD
MNRILFILAILFSQQGYSQIQNPATWNATIKYTNGDTATIIHHVKIEKGWHIYSQNISIKNGPIPTQFSYNPNSNFDLIGSTTEGKAIIHPEPACGNQLLFYFSDSASFAQKVVLKSSTDFDISTSVTFMVCSDRACLAPETREFKISVKKQTPLTANQESTSIWWIFIGGFIGGSLALLTPCVFPMLPLTVSFFTKHSKTRAKGIKNALIYAISIIAIYVTLGLVITLSLGPDAMNALASNGIMNLIFFVIFVVFAISFFGAFEITLPNKWLNASDGASEKGGLIGIFFMAFTLSLVSFSCTGPIIGSLLVQAAVNGNVIGPAMGMFGFSLALAIPFALFAAFPGWLNALPKSGGWLNSVKVVLGFIELALALKFLSSVDLAYHLGFFKREIFIALWIVIFSLLGFYLLGKLRLPHDDQKTHTSVTGLLFSVITFSFVVYLIPGMWGAPLKLISGFPPPSFYTEGWNLQTSNPQPVFKGELSTAQGDMHCPHNLNCFHNYEQGLAYAKKVNKPILLDFTGWSCVNCRKMEDNVWSDPKVLNLLSNDYVLISLYVDDKTELPESEQYTSTTTNQKIKTVGNKWSDFQTKHFKTNSQPYYALTDFNGALLSTPKGFDSSIDNYIKFLREGIKYFKNI